MNVRDLEKKKYDFIYKDQGYKPNRYGHKNYAQRIYKYILMLKPKTLLDVSCGGGEFCKWCSSKGIKTCGIDISSEPEADNKIVWLKGIAQKLPLKDKSMDFITAFDLLEHLPREDLHIALKEFKRVATRGMIFSFHYTPTIKIFDSPLHHIVEPKEWWIKQVRKYGTTIIINKENKDYGLIFFDDKELQKVIK